MKILVVFDFQTVNISNEGLVDDIVGDVEARCADWAAEVQADGAFVAEVFGRKLKDRDAVIKQVIEAVMTQHGNANDERNDYAYLLREGFDGYARMTDDQLADEARKFSIQFEEIK